MSTVPTTTTPPSAFDTIASRWFFRGVFAGAAFLASAQFGIHSISTIDTPAQPVRQPGPPPGPPPFSPGPATASQLPPPPPPIDPNLDGPVPSPNPGPRSGPLPR